MAKNGNQEDRIDIDKLCITLLVGLECVHGWCAYSEITNNELSEWRTTSVQWTNSMSPIALPIEVIHCWNL